MLAVLQLHCFDEDLHSGDLGLVGFRYGRCGCASFKRSLSISAQSLSHSASPAILPREGLRTDRASKWLLFGVYKRVSDIYDNSQSSTYVILCGVEDARVLQIAFHTYGIPTCWTRPLHVCLSPARSVLILTEKESGDWGLQTEKTRGRVLYRLTILELIQIAHESTSISKECRKSTAGRRSPRPKQLDAEQRRPPSDWLVATSPNWGGSDSSCLLLSTQAYEFLQLAMLA